MQYTDSKKLCFQTSGLWQSERAMTKIEFAGDNINVRGKKI